MKPTKKSKRKKLKKAMARRNRFYAKHHLAIPENVTSCELAVQRAIEKRGHKVYRHDRERTARFLKRLFRKYRLRGTTTEEFWRLMLSCRLIGPTKEQKNPVIVKQKPVEKSRTKSKDRKRKRRRRVKH